MSARAKGIISAVTLLAAMAFFLAVPQGEAYFTVRADGALIYALEPRGGFEVDYTHSVNRGGVRELYEFTEDGAGFRLVKGLFQNFGAGMPDGLPDSIGFGEEDGWLVLLFDEEPRTKLYYIAGTESGHTLVYNGEEYPLSDRFPGRSVTFAIAQVSPWDMITLRFARG